MPFDLSIVGQQSEPTRHAYTWRDTVLYALGVGAKVEELDYLYEGRGPDGTSAASAQGGPHQKVLPSFAVVPTFKPMFDLLGRTGGNFANIVHGGQRVVLKKPLAEITQRAIAVLSRELGTADTIRFINQFTTGFGNYTAERDSLVGQETLDQITAAIRRTASEQNSALD